MDILLSTGIQNVGSGSPIVDLSGAVGYTGGSAKTDGEYGTFAMYLFTNGSGNDNSWKPVDRITLNRSQNVYDNYSGGYDTILGISIKDIINAQNPPKEDGKTDEIQDIIGDKNTDAETAEKIREEAESFRSKLETSLLFPIDEEKKNETRFGDMYVKSAAHFYGFTEEEKDTLSREEYLKISQRNLSLLNRDSSSLCVPVGAGELPRLMEDILSALSEGGTLEEALLAQIDRYGDTDGLQSKADLIWVNPENGEVTGAYRKERTVGEDEWKTLFEDDEAVFALADDFASFIRYAVFALESDDPERVREFIAHLVNKQGYADYGRYIEDLDSEVDLRGVMDLIIANFAAAGIIGGNDEESGGESETVQRVDKGENTGNGGVLTPEDELKELLDSLGENRTEDSSDGEESESGEASDKETVE